MFEQVTNSGRAEADTVSRFDSDGAIRRYQQIQQEIARLEEERERLRDLLVKELDGKFPSKWHSTIDGKPILVVHEYKTSVRYDEPLPREKEPNPESVPRADGILPEIILLADENRLSIGTRAC